MDEKDRTTNLVAKLSGEGKNPSSAEELMPVVYDELRRRAAFYMSRERPGHTLQPTALVHEAYMKLVDQSRVNWRGRTHFFAVGAGAMRRILIDHARGRGREKRGGDWQRVTLSEPLHHAERGLDMDELSILNEALDKLARLDDREAKIVELRFFAGLKMNEVAEVLGVSKRTVEDDWVHARAWLKRELSKGRTPLSGQEALSRSLQAADGCETKVSGASLRRRYRATPGHRSPPSSS
jgi:RNA polymerase sigma factor (TIGR02999 family)